MKRRIFSIVLALCLCMSIIPAAYADAAVPTPQAVYETLIGLKEQDRYREGTAWDDSNHSYDWDGGPVAGNITGGTGCAAFAFELSDTAFGILPARTLTTGNFQLSDVRSGDILRIDNNSHSVIVLQVAAGGVVIAEANYHVSGGAGIVHWGRALSKADVEAADYLITRYPAGYVSPDDPAASEELGSGNLGSGLTWKLTKAGTLTISGSGAMPDYASASETPWSDYMDQILAITIENGVTSVGSCAFYGSQALSAAIPGSVTQIGSNAFRESALVSANIPGSVKTIGAGAFRVCSNLVSAAISEGVEQIGGNAFESCGALKSIALPASITEVGAAAFHQCTQMTEAVFAPGTADRAVIMGDNLFTQCYYLSKVTLPKRIDRISDGMFQNCLMLAALTIPEGAESIGGSAFASCSGLTQVWIPDSVTAIGIAAFSQCPLSAIYFGGSEEQWNSISKIGDTAAALSGVTKYYNAEAPETPPAPETPSTPPDGHEHVYGGWVIDVNATASQSGSRHRDCTICGYRETESIPATGGSSSNPGSDNFSGYIPPSSTTTTTTTRNPDGSTTTTKTDTRTGTVTKTTQSPDGSQTVVETQKDGTVTTKETDRAGNKTETVAKPDGSSTVTVEQKDGTTAAVTVSASGRAEAEVKLSASVVSAAQRSGGTVALPIPQVQAARSTVTVNTGSAAPVRVEIPAASPTPGTVAVIVRRDGTEEIVKTSVPTAGGVTVSVPDGAVVKLVDNSKDFADVSAQYWGADAIDFVSARELFAGTSATDFSPEEPMTRAMLMTVLARFDGADTAGGATWYEKGMEWAVANGVSDGSSPNQSITREQLVTMLWRYAGSPAAAGTLAAFADADQTSGYAQEAMRWAVENGVVSGFGNGLLGPQGQATRAQVAQMLKNFIEK